ncbi:MAG: class II glutamine amidotransferase [Gammaproteobacteria bacterium]|nr:class II glutamine amidotransferase [Pseudomonadales bacterium]MCP5347825.1 class II glutamine amidotransferase [Pseudomonadales bacterium]
MCELFAMNANTPAIVEYELQRFAAEGGERHRNRDGWGIAFMEERDAHVFREAAPASDSVLARMVIEREIPCRTMIAHVRRASRGKPRLENTHPFTRVVHGRKHHFAHNGTLKDIDKLAPELRAECVGDTDSELAFLMLLNELRTTPHGTQATAERFRLFADFAGRMAARGPANILFFDGETLFAHAHRRIFETPEGLTPAQPPGLCLRHLQAPSCGDEWRGPGARIRELPTSTILLASVPLDPDGWQALPEGYALALRNGRILHETTT